MENFLFRKEISKSKKFNCAKNLKEKYFIKKNSKFQKIV